MELDEIVWYLAYITFWSRYGIRGEGGGIRFKNVLIKCKIPDFISWNVMNEYSFYEWIFDRQLAVRGR